MTDRILTSAKVAQAYEHAPLNSLEEDLRLLEIIASALHSFGALLFTKFHPDVDLRPIWPIPTQRPFLHTRGFFVDFHHIEYHDFNEYPFGLLNVISYWAETQVLGGVVLFEHVSSESGVRYARTANLQNMN